LSNVKNKNHTVHVTVTLCRKIITVLSKIFILYAILYIEKILCRCATPHCFINWFSFE